MYVSSPLYLGALSGNRFVITLRRAKAKFLSQLVRSKENFQLENANTQDSMKESLTERNSDLEQDKSTGNRGNVAPIDDQKGSIQVSQEPLLSMVSKTLPSLQKVVKDAVDTIRHTGNGPQSD